MKKKGTSLLLASLMVLGSAVPSLALNDNHKAQVKRELTEYKPYIKLINPGIANPQEMANKVVADAPVNVINMKVSKNGNDFYLYPTYIENKVELEKTARFAAVVGEETYGMSPIEKTYYITQRITQLLEYNNSDNNEMLSPTAVLKSGEGVCQAYARFADLVFKSVGMETRMIKGTINSGTPHLWNAVKINGEWLGVDTTNADIDETGEVDFNMTLMTKTQMDKLGFVILDSGGVKFTNNPIGTIKQAGLVSIKDQKVYTMVEEGLVSTNVNNPSRVELEMTHLDKFYVIGETVLVLNNGELKTLQGQPIRKNVEETDLRSTGTTLYLKDEIIYSPIVTNPQKVRIMGESFSVKPEKGNIVEVHEGRTNVFKGRNLVLQIVQ